VDLLERTGRSSKGPIVRKAIHNKHEIINVTFFISHQNNWAKVDIRNMSWLWTSVWFTMVSCQLWKLWKGKMAYMSFFLLFFRLIYKIFLECVAHIILNHLLTKLLSTVESRMISAETHRFPSLIGTWLSTCVSSCLWYQFTFHFGNVVFL